MNNLTSPAGSTGDPPPATNCKWSTGGHNGGQHNSGTGSLGDQSPLSQAGRSTGDHQGPPLHRTSGRVAHTDTITQQDHGLHGSPIKDSPLPEFMTRVSYPHPPEGELPGREAGAHGDLHGDTDLTYQHMEEGVVQGRINGFTSWPFPTLEVPENPAKLYDCARSAAASNGPPPYIRTDLNIEQWRLKATGHSDDEWILDAIQHGFPVQYKGPPMYGKVASYNHPSATQHPETIRSYIAKEVKMGALYGPFSQPPFTPWFNVSPLMTREKPDSTERRVIVDLSYPEGGVNAHIEHHMFNGNPVSHNLPTVENAVQAIAQSAPGDVHLAVIDLSRAYQQFPVPPTDWPLLGIFFEGAYFWDGRIPFGARMSSFSMQSVASFITRAAAKFGARTFMYLDDIILVAHSASMAARQYAQILDLLHDLGLQTAKKKLQPPSRRVTWLGIVIDMDRNQLSIPDAKVRDITACLAAAARKKVITKRHLQSLLGYINHLARVVRAARTFVARMLAALRAAEGDMINVTAHVKADIAWFSRFLKTYNAKAIIPHNRTTARVWADSCLEGGGATDGKAYYSYQYPKQMMDQHHISHLEAINVLAAVRTFITKEHAGGTVEIYCDNSASVHAYSSGRARDTVLAACCRAMWYHAAATQTTLTFTHLPGEGMVLPDALSRAHLDRAMSAKAQNIVETMGLVKATASPKAFAYASFI